GRGAAALGLDRLHDRLGLLTARAIGDDHIGVAVGEVQGAVATEAAAPSGDECELADHGRKLDRGPILINRARSIRLFGVSRTMSLIDRTRVFLRVAELSSFTAAATSLGLPKASVSTAVQQLEAELGAR